MDQQDSGTNQKSMVSLLRELLRPYRASLGVILAAMLVQSTMTLAAPWPLKIILDNVVGNHKPAPWFSRRL